MSLDPSPAESNIYSAGLGSARKAPGLPPPFPYDAAVTIARYVRGGGLQPPRGEQVPPLPPVYEPGCLLNRLASRRLAHVAFLLPPPKKCSTEHLLSLQVRS